MVIDHGGLYESIPSPEPPQRQNPPRLLNLRLKSGLGVLGLLLRILLVLLKILPSLRVPSNVGTDRECRVLRLPRMDG